MYVTFDNHMYGDHATYVAVSNDGGNNWKRLSSSEFTGFAHVIREDIKNEKLLFLGTEMGFFISLDGGANWIRSKYQNMPWYNLVRDIKINPTTNDVIIASHGRGIYIIDNIESLRELVKSDLEKDVIMFPIADFKYDFSAQVPSENENMAGWVGENKAVVPVINYYLKQRSSNAVKIEVYDAANKKIRDINGTGIKGLNKVAWPPTINPPKVAKGGFVAGSTVLYSGFFGPKVPVGKYKIVLKAEGKSFEQFINILPNDAKGFSVKNMDKLYQQSMRLFNLHEKLSVLVDSMDNTLAALSKVENKSAAQQTAYTNLDSMRHEILELNRKTVFFDEFKFRRRVSDLYVQVANSLEPLTAGKEVAIGLLEKEFEVFNKRFSAILAKK
jgi:hypothetical protein